jgi:hypothetical protein
MHCRKCGHYHEPEIGEWIGTVLLFVIGGVVGFGTALFWLSVIVGWSLLLTS